MQVHVYKNFSVPAESCRWGTIPQLVAPLMNGAHCLCGSGLGTMGALLRVSWSNLTSCVVPPGKQLQVAARGPPCVWPLCRNPLGHELLFTRQSCGGTQNKLWGKARFSPECSHLSVSSAMSISPYTCMLASFLGAGYFRVSHVFLSVLFLFTLYKLKTFLKLHVHCKLN